MKVILSKEIPKLGRAGDIKEVSDGFARNFLFAKDLAKPATEVNLAAERHMAIEKVKHEEKERAINEKLAEKLKTQELHFEIKVGEKGQPFGSITAQDIADKLSAEGVEIKKQWIELEHGIKSTGEHQVKINFPHHIEGEVKIVISPSN